jgi:hypothetical protein
VGVFAQARLRFSQVQNGMADGRRVYRDRADATLTAMTPASEPLENVLASALAASPIGAMLRVALLFGSAASRLGPHKAAGMRIACSSFANHRCTVDVDRLWRELPDGLDAIDAFATGVARFAGPE